MYYIIIEGALDGMWESRYKLDPKKNPVKMSQSVFYSNNGKAVGVKLYYSEREIERASVDIKKLTRNNPNGGYCLAKLKEE